MRILVAEDEPRIAAAVARGLRREGMAVDIAPDGAAALYKARVNPYDVVVLDRDLPEVHGDDVCRTLSAEQPRTKVLMLTAARSTDELVQGLSLGADDYLTKPFRFAELVARLHALGAPHGRGAPAGARRPATSCSTPPAATATRAGRPLDLTVEGVRRARDAARRPGRGRHARGAARARVGRAARPALQHRPHDGHDAAPQARRPAADPDGPRERLPRVIPNLRIRLTAIYGGIFVVFVAILLGVSYWLMARHLDRTLDPFEAAAALGQLGMQYLLALAGATLVATALGWALAGRELALDAGARSTRASASWPTPGTSCAAR